MVTQSSSLNMQALNVTLQQVVVPLFWATLATAMLVPIAGAAGTWVAGKIDSGKQKEQSLI